MHLNKKAKRLRIRKTKAQIRLAAALASQNYVLATSLKAEIKYITGLQWALDSQQKFYLLKSESIYRLWQVNNLHHHKDSPKALAVHRNGVGPAPIYRVDVNFYTKQSVHLRTQVKTPQVFKGLHIKDFKVACAASIKKFPGKKETWDYTLAVAK